MNIETIIVGPLDVNCFIISCPKTKQSAIIDPGENADDILQSIKSKSLDVKYILLTHGHFDHIGAVADISAATHSDILLHADDQEQVDAAPAHAGFFGLPVPKSFSVDRYVNEEDTLEIGELTLTVLHTPGHSRGCVCYLGKDVIFAGDTLFYGGVGRTDLPGGNYQAIIQSIKEKLFALPDAMRVYSGHGPPTTIGREKKYNPFVS